MDLVDAKNSGLVVQAVDRPRRLRHAQPFLRTRYEDRLKQECDKAPLTLPGFDEYFGPTWLHSLYLEPQRHCPACGHVDETERCALLSLALIDHRRVVFLTDHPA